MLKATFYIGVSLAMVAFGAQTSNTAANTNSQQPQAGSSHWHNAKAMRSQELSEMLHDTNQAEAAITNGNKQQASTDVQQALNCANRITANGNHNLVTLYSELDRYSVIGPIMYNRQQRAANEAPGSGTGATQNQTGSADRMRSAQTNPDLGVKQVVGEFTSAAVDMKFAEAHLQAAQQALNQGNPRRAKEALQAVQDSVVVESVAADMPLVRARENLLMAKINEDRGKYQEARADLHAASRALSDYASIGGAHSQDANHLKSEIDSYRLSSSANHSSTDSEIESWWDQTTNWVPGGSNTNSNTTAMNGR